MENVNDLDQAFDYSVATINTLLQKPQSSLEDKKLIFVHLRLLFQLRSCLNYDLNITVPKYCSTCEGDRASPQASTPLICGGFERGCYTCSPACFVNKYCREMQAREVTCVVCGQVISIEEVAKMIQWVSNPDYS
jgi:hypothetical protein